MDYTTTFIGHIDISPPLMPETVELINAFCRERHDGPGYLTVWCDLVVADDGASIGWNGSEKPYEIPRWLEIIIARFIDGSVHRLNGTMHAHGEEAGDVWKLVCKDSVVSVVKLLKDW